MPQFHSHQFERWLFIGLLALLFWLPIPLASHRPWAWALVEVCSFTLLTGWFWLWLKQPSVANNLYPYRWLIGGLLLFQVWSLLQIIPLPAAILEIIAPQAAEYHQGGGTLSLDPDQSFVGLLKGLSYTAITWLLIALVNSPARLKSLALVVVAAGTFQACYGVLQALSGTPTSWVVGLPNSHIATGGFVYKNHFGNFLVLTLCIGIGLLIASLSQHRQQSWKEWLRHTVATLLSGKVILRLCLAMMVIGLVMSRSRMANTAFFAALSITGVLGLLLIKQKSRSLSILLVSLMAIDVLILGSWFGLEKVKNRLENTSLMSETRDEVNQYGMSLIEQFPLTGTGGGSFYSTFQSVQGPGIYSFYDLAHNDYLQFAIEFGLPATLLMGVLILLSLWHALQALRNRRNALLQGAAFAAVMAIGAELFMLTTDFHLQAPANAIYFLLVIVVAWKARFLSSSATPPSQVKPS